MGTSMAQAEAPLAQRCASVWRNDLENIPLFLFAALIFTVLGGSENLAAWLFGTYIVARYLHTVSYLLGRQPWRALCYLASVGTTWTVTLHAVWLALAALNTGAAGR